MQSQQSPIKSGFGPKTTAQEAANRCDLRGQVAIVTGGYSGLGLETVRVLAQAGAHVIVPARNAEKARLAIEGMPGVEQEQMDLGDPASIDAFAGRFLKSGRSLNILVNCAGIMACPLERDPRGFESQFAINHLGHFQLTMRLAPALRNARGARVVSVSSRGHRISGVVFDDIHFDRREYDKWKAYGQSKSANVLFAMGLDAWGEAHGIRAFSVHPGRIFTDLGRYLSVKELQSMGSHDEHGRVIADKNPNFKSAGQGAATIVWCAVNKQLEGKGGVYCEDCDISAAVPADSKGETGVWPWAIDPVMAERLWKLNEELTGAKWELA